MDTIPTKKKREPDQLATLPLSELYPRPDDPFSVRDDDAMKELTESISCFGVLNPALVRPRKAGGYEILSGKRRLHGLELAGKNQMPVIIRDLNDDEAVILLVDSNLHRPDIPPSERAKAYKMKLEAIKCQGQRTGKTCDQVGYKSSAPRSIEKIAEEAGESKTQVHARYESLNRMASTKC